MSIWFIEIKKKAGPPLNWPWPECSLFVVANELIQMIISEKQTCELGISCAQTKNLGVRFRY